MGNLSGEVIAHTERHHIPWPRKGHWPHLPHTQLWCHWHNLHRSEVKTCKKFHFKHSFRNSTSKFITMLLKETLHLLEPQCGIMFT
jgi:hypothetical protein